MDTKQIGIIFHGIGMPERTLEQGEKPYWISIERFEALLDVIAEDPKRYCITFDDGNLSDHAIALPRLLARGLRAEFFVLTGRIGQPGSLGPQEISDLLAAGMGIGSHGVAHRDWRKLDSTELHTELEDSKIVLEELCGRPVIKAGIPFGSWNARVLRALKQAGYETAWSSDGGWMRPNTFLRPRQSVRSDMSKATLCDLLQGRMRTITNLRRGISMILRQVF